MIKIIFNTIIELLLFYKQPIIKFTEQWQVISNFQRNFFSIVKLSETFI